MSIFATFKFKVTAIKTFCVFPKFFFLSLLESHDGEDDDDDKSENASNDEVGHVTLVHFNSGTTTTTSTSFFNNIRFGLATVLQLTRRLKKCSANNF